MNKKAWILTAIVVFCAAGVITYVLEKTLTKQQKSGQSFPSGQALQSSPFDGRLKITYPSEGSSVDQTFSVAGQAQGWFEGNIPIEVYDNAGNLLYSSSFVVEDNYEHPANFNVTIVLNKHASTENGRIDFTDYSAKDGKMVYRRSLNIKFNNYQKSMPSKDNGEQSYMSSQKGFSIGYSSDFGLSTDYSKIGPLGYIPVCDESMMACVFYSGDAYADTNLEAAGVSVNLRSDLGTEAKCYNFKVSTNEAQTDVGLINIGGVNFRSATGGGGAAGHFDKVQVYRDFHDGKCYELSQKTVATNIGVYDPSTLKKEFNHNEVWQKLVTIVKTFRFIANFSASSTASHS